MPRAPAPTQLKDDVLQARVKPWEEYIEARANFIAVEKRCLVDWQTAKDRLDRAEANLPPAPVEPPTAIPVESPTAIPVESPTPEPQATRPPPVKVQKDLKVLQVAKALIRQPDCSVASLAAVVYPKVKEAQAKTRVYALLHYLRRHNILIATDEGERIDIPRLQEVWPQTPRSS